MLLYYNSYFSPCYVLLSALTFWYKGALPLCIMRLRTTGGRGRRLTRQQTH
jgi:hypothetical protein